MSASYIPSVDIFERHGYYEPWVYPTRGEIYIENIYPILKTISLPFEHDDERGLRWMLFSRSHYWLGPFAAALYLLFIWLGPKVMAARRPFDLRNPLKYWNLFLAVFSFCGALRVLPQLIYVVWNYGLWNSLCMPPVWASQGRCGLWLTFFVYSKYFELIDTVFIVLRKRKLIFLHWYHHVTVLLYSWDAFINEQPAGNYFSAMNYSVHAVMYFYYYLAAEMKAPPKWAFFVTVMQISQMFFGVAITGLSIWLSFKLDFFQRSTRENGLRPLDQGACYTSRSNLFWGCAMYSTYFYLFALFFIERYWRKDKKPRGVETKRSQKVE